MASEILGFADLSDDDPTLDHWEDQPDRCSGCQYCLSSQNTLSSQKKKKGPVAKPVSDVKTESEENTGKQATTFDIAFGANLRKGLAAKASKAQTSAASKSTDDQPVVTKSASHHLAQEPTNQKVNAKKEKGPNEKQEIKDAKAKELDKDALIQSKKKSKKSKKKRGGGCDQVEEFSEFLQEKSAILSQKATEIRDTYKEIEKQHSAELSDAKEKVASVQSELDEARKTNSEEIKNLKEQIAVYENSSSVARKLKEETKRCENQKQELKLLRDARKKEEKFYSDQLDDMEKQMDSVKKIHTELREDLEKAKKRNSKETKKLKDQMAAIATEKSSVVRKLQEETKKSDNYKQELKLLRDAHKRLIDTHHILQKELDAYKKKIPELEVPGTTPLRTGAAIKTETVDKLELEVTKRRITELEVQVSTLVEMSAASKAEYAEQLNRAKEAELCILDLRKAVLSKELKERSGRTKRMREDLDQIIRDQIFKPPGDPTKLPVDDLITCQIYRNQLDDNFKFFKNQKAEMEASFDDYVRQVRGGRRLVELAAISLEQSPPDPEIPSIPAIQRAMSQNCQLIRSERGNLAIRDDESASGTAESGPRAVESPWDVLPLGAEASAIGGLLLDADQGSTGPKVSPVPNDPMESAKIIKMKTDQQIDPESRPGTSYIAAVGEAIGNGVERELANRLALSTSVFQKVPKRHEASNHSSQAPRSSEPHDGGQSHPQKKIDRLRNLVASGVHGVPGEPRVLGNETVFRDAIENVRATLPGRKFKGNNFTVEETAVLLIQNIRQNYSTETEQAAPTPSTPVPPPLSKPKVTEIGTKPKNPQNIDALWECPVCMEMAKLETLEECPGCKNCFHANCLKSWLSSRATCPVCRQHLRLGDDFPSLTV